MSTSCLSLRRASIRVLIDTYIFVFFQRMIYTGISHLKPFIFAYWEKKINFKRMRVGAFSLWWLGMNETKQESHNLASADESRMTQLFPASSGRSAVRTGDPCNHTGPALRRAPGSVVAILKFLMLFEREAPCFYFCTEPCKLPSKDKVMPPALVSWDIEIKGRGSG